MKAHQTSDVANSNLKSSNEKINLLHSEKTSANKDEIHRLQPSEYVNILLNGINDYISRLRVYGSENQEQEDKNLAAYIKALDNLHVKLKVELNKLFNKQNQTTALESIYESPAYKVAASTYHLITQLEIKDSNESFEERQIRQKNVFDAHRKECFKASRFGALAKTVAAVFITGICCVVSGALGFALGCAVGSPAGPAGAIVVGAIATPKSAAIGAAAGTAIGTALGLGSSSCMNWMRWGPFQPKTVRLGQNIVDAGKKYYAGKSC